MLGFQPSTAIYPTGTPFAKKKSAEVERIERLVKRMEGHVKRAFLRFVEVVRSDAVLKDVAELLGRGDINAALAIVDTHIARMAPVLSQVFIASANAEVLVLADQVKSWAPSIGIAFDPSNPRASELMRQAQMEFIREISTSQREAIRQALVQGLEIGAGPRETARALKDAIGLTARQEAAVRNYERLLRTGNGEALDRELRDRRFDRTVARADRTGEPLSDAQIERMTDAYRRRYIAYRAETIAATETTRVVSQARQEGLRQTIEDAGIDESLVERVWRSSKDDRVRHTHRLMDGQATTMDGVFTSSSGAQLRYPGDPRAPGFETVMCRCVAVNRIKEPETTTAGVPAPRAPVATFKQLDTSAKDAALSAGLRDGFEHLTGYDRKTRKPIEQIDGSANNFVGFSDALQAQLADPKNAIVLHHNHPKSSSLSGQDLVMLQQSPGMHSVWAHGHNGSSYLAWDAKGITRKEIAILDDRVRGILQKLVNDRTVSPVVAGASHAHLVNQALARLGFMKYQADLQGSSLDAYKAIESMADAILDKVTRR